LHSGARKATNATGWSAPRVEVARTIWFAPGLSGGTPQAIVTVAETAFTGTGARCSVRIAVHD